MTNRHIRLQRSCQSVASALKEVNGQAELLWGEDLWAETPRRRSSQSGEEHLGRGYSVPRPRARDSLGSSRSRKEAKVLIKKEGQRS